MKKALTIICALFLLWIAVSYIQVTFHNTDIFTTGTAFQYPWWNFFGIFF